MAERLVIDLKALAAEAERVDEVVADLERQPAGPDADKADGPQWTLHFIASGKKEFYHRVISPAPDRPDVRHGSDAR